MAQSCFHITLFICCLFLFKSANAQVPKLKQNNKALYFSKTDSVKQYQRFIPANFATCSYGFFCKQELKLEKQTHVPVKFRLGSIEYTNWLEGKNIYNPKSK